MNDADIIVETIPVGPLQCNCTILGDLVSRKAIVVDPGGDAEILLERLVELNLQVERIIHTHAHLDHFLASGKMKEATGAKLALHREDLFLWDMLEDQCRMFGIPFEPPPPPDQWLENEEEIDLNDFQGKALHTPGHTPGSMCFLFESQKLLIAGDTLFQGSIGRTDLWGGDFKKIEKSIQEKLYTLDEETSVITGHGESTSIGHEMRANSFVRA
ncbi:MAG: MBL fold metallo-hydrolase [SAR324 cluster bacterium]|uniref:MBL fold metallo-hydrolase n=2 Tax=SAR324 cluster bacterium TaxID=2024889 RepID=A0A432GAI9_9DELT|nr:MAG: MBL fold metallo-hydrolase [SAR324 cluster bacterium]